MDTKKLAKDAFKALGKDAPKWSELKEDDQNTFGEKAKYYVENVNSVPRDFHNFWLQLLGQLGYGYAKVDDEKNKKLSSLIPYPRVGADVQQLDKMFWMSVRGILNAS